MNSAISSTRSRRTKAIVGWTVLAMAVFLSFIGRDAAMGSHELRVVETARTMARSGWPWSASPSVIPSPSTQASAQATWSVNPWLVPIFGGQIRLQKPPLPYWVTAICFKCVGEGAGAARLVPALLGVMSCLLTYRLAVDVAGRRVGLIALALAVSSWFVISEYRKSMADPYLACLTLTAIVSWIHACRGKDRAEFVLFFYLALAAATMAKGPVAFLHVGVAILAFGFCFRRRPRAPMLTHAFGAATFALVALPWPLYVILRVPGAMEIWRYESVGEFADNLRNARPFYFYLPGLLLISAPWTVAWFKSIAMTIVARQRHRAFATIWLVLLVLIFSCSHMKKYAYLLPAVPAITLASAQGIVRLIAEARRRKDSSPLRWIAVGHWIGGLAFATAVGVTSIRYVVDRPTAISVATVALFAALLPLVAIRRFAFERWLTLQAMTFALLIALFLAFPQTARHTLRHGVDPTATNDD